MFMFDVLSSPKLSIVKIKSKKYGVQQASDSCFAVLAAG